MPCAPFPFLSAFSASSGKAEGKIADDSVQQVLHHQEQEAAPDVGLGIVHSEISNDIFSILEVALVSDRECMNCGGQEYFE